MKRMFLSLCPYSRRKDELIWKKNKNKNSIILPISGAYLRKKKLKCQHRTKCNNFWKYNKTAKRFLTYTKVSGGNLLTDNYGSLFQTMHKHTHYFSSLSRMIESFPAFLWGYCASYNYINEKNFLRSRY